MGSRKKCLTTCDAERVDFKAKFPSGRRCTYPGKHRLVVKQTSQVYGVPSCERVVNICGYHLADLEKQKSVMIIVGEKGTEDDQFFKTVRVVKAS